MVRRAALVLVFLAIMVSFMVPSALALTVVRTPSELTTTTVLPDRAWPAGQATYSFELIGGFFVDGTVGVQVDWFWDDGPHAGSHLTDGPYTWGAGARGAKSGSADVGATFSSFKFGEPPTVDNPDRVRLTLIPVSGTPNVGLRAD